ncbi:hypothetical protein BGZ63DRAFT_406648 [Mariannaea sp. PMI_226]|nr:hypothetical protein BGZ63DRAFT_406648 [Mariannaea sp. PMI_226]
MAVAITSSAAGDSNNRDMATANKSASISTFASIPACRAKRIPLLRDPRAKSDSTSSQSWNVIPAAANSLLNGVSEQWLVEDPAKTPAPSLPRLIQYSGTLICLAGSQYSGVSRSITMHATTSANSRVKVEAGPVNVANVTAVMGKIARISSRCYGRIPPKNANVHGAREGALPPWLCQRSASCNLVSIADREYDNRVGVINIRRIPRVAPDVDIQYHQWRIPKNTPVGMSVYAMHMDPEVDPNMDRNFVPFITGSRACLGSNLAYAELHLVLAVLFRPGGPKLSIYDTDESDVKPALDYILSIPKLNSRGLRVTVE